MGSQYIANPIEFLVSTLFGLYILAVMLRFLLQMVRADFYNPISQFLVKITQPPLRPLRRILPGWGGVDLASIVLLILLQMLSLGLVNAIRGIPFLPGPLFFFAIGELVRLLLNIYLFAIIIQAILSWVNPGGYNPALGLLHSLTEPVLRPARRLLPPISGLDLSPIVVLIAIQLLKMLLLPPIYQLARAVA